MQKSTTSYTARDLVEAYPSLGSEVVAASVLDLLFLRWAEGKSRPKGFLPNGEMENGEKPLLVSFSNYSASFLYHNAFVMAYGTLIPITSSCASEGRSHPHRIERVGRVELHPDLYRDFRGFAEGNDLEELTEEAGKRLAEEIDAWKDIPYHPPEELLPEVADFYSIDQGSK